MMNTHDRSDSIAGVGAAFLVWAWITMCLRCFVRIHVVKKFGLDDFIMVGALLCFTVVSLVSIIGSRYGAGRHMSELEAPQIRTALLCWYIAELFYTLSVSLVKISIGFFLLRIVVVPLQRWILSISMIVTAVTGIFAFFMLLLQCSPVNYFWNRSIRPTSGHCIDTTIIANSVIVQIAVGGACDFIFGLLPIWIVKELNISWRAKATAGILLGMGAIAGIATMIRLPYAHTLETDSDFLWITTDIAIWSLVEIGLGISAGSLATTRPLLSRFSKQFAHAEPTPPQTNVATIGSGEQRPYRRGWTTWQLSLANSTQMTSMTADDELPITGMAESIPESRADGKDRQDIYFEMQSYDHFQNRHKQGMDGSFTSSCHDAS